MTNEAQEGRKKPGESWESFADRRIREAKEAGQFENLPGFGEPIPDINQPWNENSWIQRKLKVEGIQALPPVLEMRLEIEKTLEQLSHITREAEVRRKLERLNERIHEAHFSHIAGPADGVRPVDIEVAVARWKRQRESM